MLSFDDPRWAEMKGGYKTLFDPRPLLKRLESEVDIAPVWRELWDELHHQGDIGEASLAAVPYIVRAYLKRTEVNWNAYRIVAIVDLARNRDGNPDVPAWLGNDYIRAIHALAAKGISELANAQDRDICREILSIVALEKGLRNHARLLMYYSDDEIGQMEFSWKR